jgi:hypothetical protein
MVRVLLILIFFSSNAIARECKFNEYSISKDDKYIAFELCELMEGESSGGYFKTLMSILGWDFEFNQECYLIKYDLVNGKVVNNIPVNDLFDGYQLNVVEFSQVDNTKLLLTIFNKNHTIGSSFEDVIEFDIETSNYTRIFEGQENISNIFPLDDGENIFIDTYSRNKNDELILGIFNIVSGLGKRQNAVLVTRGEYEASGASLGGNVLYFNSYPISHSDFGFDREGSNLVHLANWKNGFITDVEIITELDDYNAHNPTVSDDGTLVFSSRKSGLDRNGHYMFNLFIKRLGEEVKQFTHYDQFIFPPIISRSGDNVIFFGEDESGFRKLQVISTKDNTVVKISPKDIDSRCDY